MEDIPKIGSWKNRPYHMVQMDCHSKHGTFHFREIPIEYGEFTLVIGKANCYGPFQR